MNRALYVLLEGQIMKRRRTQKPWNRQKVPGDHKIRFFRDAKSGHPFMSISMKNNYHYGHEMTTSPSLDSKEKPRKNYIRLATNPNKNDKRRSFYNRSIKRINNKPSHLGNRLRRYKNWKITRKDLKRLKRVDKKRIKNVRLADD